jgi:predicted DNA-binding protein (MmcQ/YjbR family)
MLLAREAFIGASREEQRMTRQEIIDYCLTFSAAYEDYPFDNITDPGSWTVMRHRANKKSFALIYERDSRLCVNLKCDPLDASILRQALEGVTQGYHMNHEHWNTVIVGSDVSDAELQWQIGNSYELIKPKIKRQLDHAGLDPDLTKA